MFTFEIIIFVITLCNSILVRQIWAGRTELVGKISGQSMKLSFQTTLDYSHQLLSHKKPEDHPSMPLTASLSLILSPFPRHFTHLILCSSSDIWNMENTLAIAIPSLHTLQNRISSCFFLNSGDHFHNLASMTKCNHDHCTQHL